MKNNKFFTPEDLTADKLKKGEYKDLVPEIYDLTSVVENVPWHLNQDVFSHLVKSVKYMEDSLYSGIINSLSPDYAKSIKNYLNRSVDGLSISKILILTALLHDVSKDTTIKYFPDGSTKCPGHEAESAKRIPDYAVRFGLSKSQEKLLQQLVADHDYGHQAVAKVIGGGSSSESIQLLKQQTGENYIAICLFTLADMGGGDLNKSNPEEFNKRQEIVKNFLEHSPSV